MKQDDYLIVKLCTACLFIAVELIFLKEIITIVMMVTDKL